ncbi:two-component sensor histidine kinase [Sphingomonas sp. LH128]|uniref:histidine kinase n=1 Tax=Novosphingobium resinovorum TaxID=158500 RepID=A0A1D8A3P2_9SPHN|nr:MULTISPECIES: sensor histidine kinase [Sphingomonadaceae]AOR76712.1 histidine kinase [Novosphingobium resinovorum]EJU11470.1 two-component sensor histidine kinase [Sphingomonas sp. LH128]
MSGGAGRAISLRFRLLLAMFGPLAALALVLGLLGWVLISDVVRRTNDRVLGGALGAIAETVQVERGEVTLDLPPAAFGMLENSERDNVYYRIAVGNTLLTGYADLPAPDISVLSVDEPRFRFAQFRGQRIRIAEIRRNLPRIDAPVVVQVAETLQNRNSLRDKLMIALLIGECVLVGIVLLLIRPALGWSLRPLSDLRGVIEARDTRAAPDLSPLRTGPLPTELRPLSRSFDRLLARLDDATTGMRRFTADASHQMRTPLSVLKVQVALARRGSGEALHEIEEATDRLERLLTQLLTLARADEAGVLPPDHEIDLKELSQHVISRRIRQAIEADVELLLEAGDGPYRIHGHRTLVFEMLSNLVDNAIRYNRPGGMAQIELSAEAGVVRLAVVDTGPGIPAELREMAMSRFARLQGERGPPGSGLGLAIVKSTAERMGAQLELGDAKPGLRVTVTFTV